MKLLTIFYSVCFAFFLMIVPAASAHDATLTYTNVIIAGSTLEVHYVAPYENILKVHPETDKKIDDIDLKFFNPQFQKGFTVKNSGKLCRPQFVTVRNKQDSKEVIYSYTFICDKEIEIVSLGYNLFFQLSSGHENIMDVSIDEYTVQTILSKKNPTYTTDTKTIRSQLVTYHTLWNSVNFFVLGMKHILQGYDHVLFLIGLLLGLTKLKQLLKVVTSFTVAHSITLIIATLGFYVLPARLTESIIALSISYIALENYFLHRKKPAFIQNKYLQFFSDPSKRWIITFFFGLIHGFGFSSVLRDIGLPKNGLIVSLFSFNIGVEIGQLLIVAIIFPLLWFVRKKRWQTTIIITVSIFIGIIGFFWFIQRAFLG